MTTDDYGDPAEMAYRDLDEDGELPCGSCEECGTNLYPEDDGDYCDQCILTTRADVLAAVKKQEGGQ